MSDKPQDDLHTLMRLLHDYITRKAMTSPLYMQVAQLPPLKLATVNIQQGQYEIWALPQREK